MISKLPNAAMIETLRPKTLAEIARAYRAAGSTSVVPTGIDSIDRAVGGGLACGQVHTLMGYTGTGKSELARHIRNKAALLGHNVLHVDVELGANRLIERDISQTTGIPSSVLRRQGGLSTEQNATVDLAVERLPKNIVIMTPGGTAPLNMLVDSVAETLVSLANDKPALVVLDSLQRLAAGATGVDTRQQTTNFMWRIEQLAKATGAAFLLTSEQKRGKDGKAPTAEEALTSGAESRAIEFVSDTVLVIVPADKIDDATAGDAQEKFERRSSILVAKTREGRTGYVPQYIVFEGPCWGIRLERRVAKGKRTIPEVASDLASHMIPGMEYSRARLVEISELDEVSAKDLLDYMIEKKVIEHGGHGVRLVRRSKVDGTGFDAGASEVGGRAGPVGPSYLRDEGLGNEF